MYLTWTRRFAIVLAAVLAIDGVSSTAINVTKLGRVLRELSTSPLALYGSPACANHSEMYLNELENLTPWALKMYDASAKAPSGLITGAKLRGNFDECLEVRNDKFVGQACYAQVTFTVVPDDGTPHERDVGDLLVNVAIASDATPWRSGAATYEWMVCVPSSCTSAEVRKGVEYALDQLKVAGRVNVVVSVPPKACHTIESARITWDAADYVFTTLLGIVALIAIAGTGYYLAVQHEIIASRSKDILLKAFSLCTNFANMMRTSQSGSIKCINGIKTLSTFYIIFGHTYYTEVISENINLVEVPKIHEARMSPLILNANLVTDTFFLLSGTLLAYIELSRKENSNLGEASQVVRHYGWNYIHRYMRLTPPYAMMIGFYATLFNKLDSGPRWDSVDVAKAQCRENWWTNLLYINNYINAENMCMIHSWYLAVEMQLVLLSPIILIPMHKLKTSLFNTILGVLVLVSALVPGIITFARKLPGTMNYYKSNDATANIYLLIYITVYCRFGTYLIGIGLGNILHRYRTVKLRYWQVTVGWIAAIVSGLAAIFGGRSFYFQYSPVEASVYAGLHRHTFALTIGWIIFCCEHGYAGFVNHLLSWDGWAPLSKLSYCAYLCHYVVLVYFDGAARTTGRISTINIVRTFFGNLVLTYMLATVWSLCFEMPFFTLDRRVRHYWNRLFSSPAGDFGKNAGGAWISCRNKPASRDGSSGPTNEGYGSVYTITKAEER